MEEDEKYENLPLSFEPDHEKSVEMEVEKTATKDERPTFSKQITETGNGNKKIKITVESDIRIKNYISHLAPIALIRKRFKESRYIEPLDVEDILNYVIT